LAPLFVWMRQATPRLEIPSIDSLAPLRRLGASCPAMSEPVTRLNAALEGRYAIERELGEGGMATVYLAEDLKHGQQGRAQGPQAGVGRRGRCRALPR